MPKIDRTLNVVLALRVRFPDGSRRYLSPCFASNNKLRPQYALVGGKPEHFPGSTYSLRYRTPEAKIVWEAVGSDAQMALTAKLKREHLLSAEKLGFIAKSPKQAKQDSPNRKLLATAIADYLGEVTVRNGKRTVTTYTHGLNLFSDSCSKQYLDEIDRNDVTAFVLQMRKAGSADRTAANRVCILRSLLRWAGRPEVVRKQDIPRYTNKIVAAYSRQQLQALFQASSTEDRLVWQFFVESGGREQEVMYACWSDIDFASGLFHVQEKPDFAFRLKDREERSVPIPDSLLAALKARREGRPKDRLIFPTHAGKPEGHFLRRLKAIALRAGMNCGHCVKQNGKSCATHPCCRGLDLHRLRKSFATLHHESGVSARTLMAWLGHADFQTTLTYLQAADVKSERTRALVNNTFSSP